jgi:hypothetical protein
MLSLAIILKSYFYALEFNSQSKVDLSGNGIVNAASYAATIMPLLQMRF